VLAKDPDRAADLDRVLGSLLEGLRVVTVLLHPYLPATAARLLGALGAPELALEGAAFKRAPAQTGGEARGEHRIEAIAPLFPRVN
jgi:methionyl-tRNA synthetase